MKHIQYTITWLEFGIEREISSSHLCNVQGYVADLRDNEREGHITELVVTAEWEVHPSTWYEPAEYDGESFSDTVDSTHDLDVLLRSE